MASANSSKRPLPTGGPVAGGDDLDDIFNYGQDDDDPFADGYKASNARDNTKATGSKAKGDDAPGILDLVEVVQKPRAPRVKLDENRLLSDAGIPKLRKNARKHLKFKGKGHEYSDASRLLAFYQLWLDDLFPKAKFLDALAMVEKMGHKKRMQSMRMEWINEGKPKSSVHEDSLFDEPEVAPRENGEREQTASRIAPIFEKAITERPKTPEAGADAEMDDIYDATPRAARQKPAGRDVRDSIIGRGASIFGPAKTSTVNDGAPDDDDLDALLAEEEMMQAQTTKVKPVNKPVAQEDDFDDDLDALLAEEDMMQIDNTKPKPASKPVPHEDDFDDDMEAMAEMGF